MVPSVSLDPEPSKVIATFTVPLRSGPAFAVGGWFGRVVDVVVETGVEVVDAREVEVVDTRVVLVDVDVLELVEELVDVVDDVVVVVLFPPPPFPPDGAA